MAKNNKSGYSQSKTLKEVLKYIKKYMFYVALSVIFAAATVAMTLYVPILTGDAIDLIVGKGNVDFSAVYAIVKKIIIVVGLTALSQWIMNIR